MPAFSTHPERVERRRGDDALVALLVPLALGIGPALIGRLYGNSVDDDGDGVMLSFTLILVWPAVCALVAWLVALLRRQPSRRALLLGLAAGGFAIVTGPTGFVILELAWPNPYWCSDVSCGFGA